MNHVDEGNRHEYLDGELTGNRGPKVARIKANLAVVINVQRNWKRREL